MKHDVSEAGSAFVFRNVMFHQKLDDGQSPNKEDYINGIYFLKKLARILCIVAADVTLP
jgi:hypothetical protein